LAWVSGGGIVIGIMSTGTQIHLLSEAVANKIAAGEVVERPASVLKELVENALDAGARRLEVEIAVGGRKLVEVADDGCGMSRDDALLSIERHATSKISTADELERVATLGFRGEALAAIAAVSRFSMITRRKEDDGATELIVNGGRIQDVREVGAPPGTRVAVRSLFFNVPARRRFLRSEQTEAAHLRQVFITYSLARCDAAMRLRVDGRETYNFGPGESLEERIRSIFGADFVESMRAVDFGGGDLRVKGFVGLPHVSRSDRSGQYIFINGRPAQVPLVSYALREAYRTVLPKERHPVVLLFIEMPASSVDVNVHPAKREVRFRRPGPLRDLLIGGIREVLSSAADDRRAVTRPAAVGHELGSDIFTTERTVARPAVQYPSSQLSSLPESMPLSGLRSEEQVPRQADTQKSEGEPGSRPWRWCRILGQAGGLYVVLETEEGIVLMDPHAAHERVLYEKFMHELERHSVKTQGLLSPETVEMEPRDAERVRTNLDLLRRSGFGVDEFGEDTFIVDAIPSILGDVSAAVILGDVARSLERSGMRGASEEMAEARIARAACRAAVKARDRLTLREIERLVSDLAQTEMPYTCPHGRPTMILTTFHELARKFGRE